MQTQILYPPLHLRKYIRFLWTLEYNEPSACQTFLKIFACRYPRLVFQHSHGKSAITSDEGRLPTCFLSGLHTTPQTLTFANKFSLTGISFYPVAVEHLFGIEASELIDKFPDLHEMLPGTLNAELLNLHTPGQRIQRLIAYFSRRAAGVDPPKISSIDIVSHLKSANDDNTIHHLAKAFKISERQLERRFRTATGFGPKQFLRISRFEKAVELIHQVDGGNLSGIAFELNYADQSHFIREFREYAGYTPKRFSQQEKLTTDTSSMLIRTAV